MVPMFTLLCVLALGLEEVAVNLFEIGQIPTIGILNFAAVTGPSPPPASPAGCRNGYLWFPPNTTTMSSGDPVGQHGNCQGTRWSSSTSFSAVQILSTHGGLHVSATDRTHATARIPGSHRHQLGEAESCGYSRGHGTSVLDFRGLPVALEDYGRGAISCDFSYSEADGDVAIPEGCPQWQLNGWYAFIRVRCTHQNQLCNIECGGGGGGCRLRDGQLRLKIINKALFESQCVADAPSTYLFAAQGWTGRQRNGHNTFSLTSSLYKLGPPLGGSSPASTGSFELVDTIVNSARGYKALAYKDEHGTPLVVVTNAADRSAMYIVDTHTDELTAIDEIPFMASEFEYFRSGGNDFLLARRTWDTETGNYSVNSAVLKLVGTGVARRYIQHQDILGHYPSKMISFIMTNGSRYLFMCNSRNGTNAHPEDNGSQRFVDLYDIVIYAWDAVDEWFSKVQDIVDVPASTSLAHFSDGGDDFVVVASMMGVDARHPTSLSGATHRLPPEPDLYNSFTAVFRFNNASETPFSRVQTIPTYRCTEVQIIRQAGMILLVTLQATPDAVGVDATWWRFGNSYETDVVVYLWDSVAGLFENYDVALGTHRELFRTTIPGAISVTAIDAMGQCVVVAGERSCCPAGTRRCGDGSACVAGGVVGALCSSFDGPICALYGSPAGMAHCSTDTGNLYWAVAVAAGANTNQYLPSTFENAHSRIFQVELRSPGNLDPSTTRTTSTFVPDTTVTTTVTTTPTTVTTPTTISTTTVSTTPVSNTPVSNTPVSNTSATTPTVSASSPQTAAPTDSADSATAAVVALSSTPTAFASTGSTASSAPTVRAATTFSVTTAAATTPVAVVTTFSKDTSPTLSIWAQVAVAAVCVVGIGVVGLLALAVNNQMRSQTGRSQGFANPVYFSSNPTANTTNPTANPDTTDA